MQQTVTFECIAFHHYYRYYSSDHACWYKFQNKNTPHKITPQNRILQIYSTACCITLPLHYLLVSDTHMRHIPSPPSYVKVLRKKGQIHYGQATSGKRNVTPIISHSFSIPCVHANYNCLLVSLSIKLINIQFSVAHIAAGP